MWYDIFIVIKLILRHPIFKFNSALSDVFSSIHLLHHNFCHSSPLFFVIIDCAGNQRSQSRKPDSDILKKLLDSAEQEALRKQHLRDAAEQRLPAETTSIPQADLMLGNGTTIMHAE